MEVQQVQMPDIMGAITNALGMRRLLQQEQAAAMQLQESQQATQQRQQLRALFSQPDFDTSKPDNLAKVYAISPEYGATMAKNNAELLKTQADLGKTRAETAAKNADLWTQIAHNAAAEFRVLPLDVQQRAATDHTIHDGIWRKHAKLLGVGVPDTLDWASLMAMDQSPAMQKEQIAGAEARGQLPYQQSRDTYKAGLDYRNSADLKGIDYDNQVKLKGVLSADAERAARAQEVAARRATVPPSGVVEGYINNHTAISKIDQALGLLNARPEGVGLAKGVSPDWLLTRTDPQGIALRALIADIGSMKIHDRSGAAVAASEFPRLIPFIPKISDTPEAIREKLANFRKEYESQNQGFEAAYGPETGYSLPQLGRGQPTQPQQSQPSIAKYQVGQIIPTQRGVKVRVTGFLPDGRPTVEPAE